MAKKKLTGASKGATGTAIRALEGGQRLKAKELRALKAAKSKGQLEQSTADLLEALEKVAKEKVAKKKEAKKEAAEKKVAKKKAAAEKKAAKKKAAAEKKEATKKKAAKKKATKKKAAKKKVTKKVVTCKIKGCPGFGKEYAGARWETHLHSKAHQQAITPKPVKKKVPKEPTTEELFSKTTCIYCGEEFETWDAWVRHVSSKKFAKASERGATLPEIEGEGGLDRAELSLRALGQIEDLQDKIRKKEEAVAEAHADHEAESLRLSYALEAFERAKKTKSGSDDLVAEIEVKKAMKTLQKTRKKESSARATLDRLRGDLSDLTEHREWLKGNPLG